MKRSSTMFLQAVIVLIGVGALAFMLGEPHIEGVNAHATLFEMYFNLFVAYVYIASIPFFVASIRRSRCWDMPEKILRVLCGETLCLS